MKFIFVILLSLHIGNYCNSQVNQYRFYQLYQLDSIGHSSSISRHFGELYYNFLLLVEEKLEKEDSATQNLVRNFEVVFARFYIDACIAYKNKTEVSLPAWRAYFKDSTLESFQYYLLGTNAHLNGGLAEAIGGSYTAGQWTWIKQRYHLFNSCLNKTYRYVYRTTINNNKRARALHALSLGTDKMIGNYYLYKWRKRQMRLMKYHFTRSSRYQKLFDKINRRKEKIDRLVLTQF